MSAVFLQFPVWGSRSERFSLKCRKRTTRFTFTFFQMQTCCFSLNAPSVFFLWLFISFAPDTLQFWWKASKRDFEMPTRRPEWRPGSKPPGCRAFPENAITITLPLYCLSLYSHLFFFTLFCCLVFFCLLTRLLSLKGPTGAWGTTSQVKPTRFTTPWSRRTRGRCSPVWRVPAAWPPFPRATAPHLLPKRALSNECWELLVCFLL